MGSLRQGDRAGASDLPCTDRLTRILRFVQAQLRVKPWVSPTERTGGGVSGYRGAKEEG